MGGLRIAAKCNKCGQWNGLITTDVHKARMFCKVSNCGQVTKLRQDKNIAHTWNVKVRFCPYTSTLDDFIRYLNGPWAISYKTKGRNRTDKEPRRYDEAVAEAERVTTAVGGPNEYTLIRLDVEDGI